MKNNTLALNIGEEALIEGFGIVKCIVNNLEPYKACANCYFGKGILGGCKAVGMNLFPYCSSEDRKDKNLNNIEDDVIYTRITAIVKHKNN